ncbi:sensor histidine kinase [Pedobacter mucosus]|uniref:sensor histidine kinase n=1 Tax=Pedobacter mucosus TaxID=2895286 RepID=UPI001EE443C2|nr:sensor histidine kinase [Pedobacter mucosus]UKT64904.1 sensor histidine kinase [Pedobacter mucosus]
MDLKLIHSQLSPINLDQLLNKIKEEWVLQKSLPLSLNITLSSASPIVMANGTLLQIALDNIISNAFKFSDQQTVSCRLSELKHNYLIEIHDQGNGIPLSEQNNIFKPFYSGASNMGQKGEGMGLYMAHKIIGLLKGSISIGHIKAGGCTFLVKLPKV